MRNVIISLIANRRIEFVDWVLSKFCNILCLDYNEVFMYNLGDGEKEYTLPSLYIRGLKDIIKHSNYDNKLHLVKILSSSKPVDQLRKDCHIIKNDPRLIDTGLCAIDRKLFELENSFFYWSSNYLDLKAILEFKDISHAVFSFYYMYIAEAPDMSPSFRHEVQKVFREATLDDLEPIYKAKMPEMLSYLEENKHHRLASVFLKKSKTPYKKEIWPKFSGGIFYNGSNVFKIEENDQRIIGETLEDKVRNDEAILLIANFIKEHKTQEVCNALKKHMSDKTFNVNTIFTNGNERYTLASYYLYFLKDQMQYIAEDEKVCTVGLLDNLLNNSQYQWTVEEQDRKDCYIRKNDRKLIDIGLCAIDGKSFNFANNFYSTFRNKCLDFKAILEFNDISHAVFSFYYMYIVDHMPRYSSTCRMSITNRLNDSKPHDLMSTYKAKMLEMISYLEENKYHRLARLFLKEYFSNKDLYEAGIEHNILSCYSYVLNQMEDIQIENMYAAEESQSIAKPQVAPKSLKDIMIFLEEKKYHALTNALFNEYSSNKVLDASAVFMYDMGDGEKACTPLTLSVFYALKELEKKNKVDKEFENYKAYLADNVYLMSESDPLVKKCIENAEGIRKKSLISISQNKKQYTICHGFCKHLYNKTMQYREEMKKQIYNEYVMCVEIMDLILYYQE